MTSLTVSASTFLHLRPLLAAATRESTYGIGIGPHASAVDSLTTFLLGLVLGIFGTLAAIVWITRRRRKATMALEIDELITSSQQPGVTTPSQDEKPPSPSQFPWEKSGDWWKEPP